MSDDEKQFVKAINFFRKYKAKAGSELYTKILLQFCDKLEAYLNRTPEQKDTDKFTAEVQAAIF